MKSGKIKKYLMLSAPLFCVFFMLFLFGPSEIFFANLPEFNFPYQQFVGIAILVVVVLTVVFSVLLFLVPEKAKNIIIAIISGVMLDIYIQVMFLNKKLDLLGANPDGYHPGPGKCVMNMLFWMIVIALCAFVSSKKTGNYIKIASFAAVFLILIQTAGLVQLLVTADDKAYDNNAGVEWMLSGKRQMEIGSENNVIVISLDYFSNQYVAPMLEKYPDALDALNDFTYYDNEECVYMGTYPSLAHILTGCEVEPEKPINTWLKEIWTIDKGGRFYKEAHDAGYTVMFFEDLPHVLVGSNSIQLLSGIFDNAAEVKYKINYEKMMKLMYRLSLFRAAPQAIKTFLYGTDSSFNVYDRGDSMLCVQNYDYYDRLKDEGLHFGDSKNCFTYTHLMGPHEITTNEKCQHDTEVERQDTCRGCLTLVEEYLQQLKKLGKYDDSTIIITSDHGGEEEPQTIFFIKNPYETHDELIISHKPISHCEILPTIAKAMGLNGDYGKTIDDIPDELSRERTYWLGKYDENYPTVSYYDASRQGSYNVYYGYKYIGDYDDLYEKICNGPDMIVSMEDSMY